MLLVEDDAALRETLAYNLRLEGYETLTAADGVRALELARAQPLALVLLDVMLPRLDGLEVLRQLRGRAETARVPVLMLTARAGESDIVAGLELGADDYVTKPFSWNEVRARVRALLRRGSATTGAALPAAEPIDLAPKEFGILEYMMRNKGRPLSRTMIVEHVWDMDYDGLTNIVDVYIRHLRSKIDDRFPQKLIQTVRGIGYMIEAPDRPMDKAAEPAAERQV